MESTLNGVRYEDTKTCADCGRVQGAPGVWVSPHFRPGEWNKRVTLLCTTCSFKPENQVAAGTLCHEHFERDRQADSMSMADVMACPDCVAARQAREDRIQADHTIDPTVRYGEHIALTCRNHPDLRWHTKNIDCIGARSIFFSGWDRGETECECTGRDLVVLRLWEAGEVK